MVKDLLRIHYMYVSLVISSSFQGNILTFFRLGMKPDLGKGHNESTLPQGANAIKVRLIHSVIDVLLMAPKVMHQHDLGPNV